MSVFGTNQVEELIVLRSTNAKDSVRKASVVANTVDTEGEKFKLVQEEGDVLTSQFSDVIDPSKVERVILKEFSPAVEKSVKVGNFVDSAIVADATYILETRILEDGGALSSENFAIVSGYYQTGASDNAQTVAENLAASINTNLTRRGGDELEVIAQEDSGNAGEYEVIVTSKPQRVVAGKIVGRPIKFSVIHKIFTSGDPVSENVNNVNVETVALPSSGVGTGKYAVNLEWFTKGFKYEPYRQTGYPADFGERIPFFASASNTYNVIHIKYFSDRQSPSVEKQNKVLTTLVERTDLASNSDTNLVLAELRLALGTGKVPADLDVA
jgi:hypothetical protein